MDSGEIIFFLIVGVVPFVVGLTIHGIFHGGRKILTRQAIINALLGGVGGLLLSSGAAWGLGHEFHGQIFAASVIGALLTVVFGSGLTDKFMPYADEVAEERQAEEEAAVEEEIREEMRRRAKAKLASTVGRVFISYRREDGALARLIADQLENEFGPDHIFFDVDSIRLGADFIKAINSEIAKCEVLLALIRRNWLGRNRAGQRLFDNPNDYMRLEIAAALQRQIRVIPVLLDGATMPKGDQLPADLQELARRNAHFLRHVSFKADMEILVRELKAHGGEVGNG
jgi:hypothetical protein